MSGSNPCFSLERATTSLKVSASCISVARGCCHPASSQGSNPSPVPLALNSSAAAHHLHEGCEVPCLGQLRYRRAQPRGRLHRPDGRTGGSLRADLHGLQGDLQNHCGQPHRNCLSVEGDQFQVVSSATPGTVCSRSTSAPTSQYPQAPSRHRPCTCYAESVTTLHMPKKKLNSIDELAALTQKEFLAVGQRFDRLD